MTMPGSTLRSFVNTPQPKIGTFLFEFATPGIGQILKAAGADYAVLDMEHTGFSFDTVRQIVRYCQAADLPLIVRVPSQQRHHISRALEAGADGIMLPRFAEQNARTAIILQIEDPRGAAAADEIAAMPGVDMLWLGHNDLSVALNKPGAFDDPEFAKAERATIAAAKKHGKSAGRLAVDARQAAQFVKLGYDFVSIAGDVWLLQQAFAAGVETIRRGS